MPPDMPAAKLRPVGPSTIDDAAGHVFAAMIAGAFDHGDGAGIAHGEALAGDAAEIAFAGDRAVHHGVADDDGFFRHDAGIRRRLHDDAAARQALADIVVAFAFEFEGDALARATRRSSGRRCPSATHGWCRRAGLHGRNAWPLRPTASRPRERSMLRISNASFTGAPRSSAACAPARSACGRGSLRDCGPASRC